MKEVQEQQTTEKEIMERIKKKMDRIRAYQQKIRGDKNMEPETHFQGSYKILLFMHANCTLLKHLLCMIICFLDITQTD